MGETNQVKMPYKKKVRLQMTFFFYILKLEHMSRMEIELLQFNHLPFNGKAHQKLICMNGYS